MFKCCLKTLQGLLLCAVFFIPAPAQVQLNNQVNLKIGVLHYKENKPDGPADFTLTIPKQRFIEGIVEPKKLKAIVLGNDVQRE